MPGTWTVAQKRDVFGILTTGFKRGLISHWVVTASTERNIETKTQLNDLSGTGEARQDQTIQNNILPFQVW